MREKYFIKRRRKGGGKSSCVCARKEVRELGDRGLQTKSQDIVSDARTVKRYTGKRKRETGDLGQRSRESKWIMIGFNQISTTNKIFPGSANHFTIRTSHD